MNVHPIFVHFPIAFLFVWSLLQIRKLDVWFPGISWKSVRDIVLVVGFVGALVALLTGDIASEIVGETALIETHSTFAIITTIVYGLFVVEIAGRIITTFTKTPEVIKRLIDRYVYVIRIPWFRTILVVVGLVCVFMTGLLGGAIVYGAEADPLSGPLLHLLGL
jgi:uncharacterized membrane protein (DUF441 family)